ncbi:MAG: ParA family protein [Deltaproteobacteria bacterium]|nr:ParA family protein [Deltaproteobacteria bacterium]
MAGSWSDTIRRLTGMGGRAGSGGGPRARVLAVAAQKGGVGKTTTAVNLAVAFARYEGLRTLLLDLDGQGHVGAALASQFTDGDTTTLSDVLLGHGRDVDELVHPTRIAGLWLVPSDKGLAATEGILAGRIGKEFLLRGAIRRARERFDVVVIDCPPNLGNLTLNALTASDACLVPCDMSVLAMGGVADLLGVVETLRDRLDHDVRIAGIVPTRVDRRNARVTAAVMEGLDTAWGDLVCRTRIPVSSALARAQMDGVNVFDYDATSPGAVAYRELASEVATRLALRVAPPAAVLHAAG